MAEMMKEVVVVEPHKYEVREVEIPELANEDEVLIQMKSAGVCGSDHHIWHGSNPCSTYPRIPGHENAGVIAKIGKNAFKGIHKKAVFVVPKKAKKKLRKKLTAKVGFQRKTMKIK